MPVLEDLDGRSVESLSEPERIVFDLAVAHGYAAQAMIGEVPTVFVFGCAGGCAIG